MAVEIERKFLVKDPGWRVFGGGVLYRQGYFATGAGTTVRVRASGDQGWLTIKGPTVGLRRLEFEYPIPFADADQMLNELCRSSIIEKHRFRVEHGGLVWEVDEFHGTNEGLVIAEVELDTENQEIELPDWVGDEVSSDARYYNQYLVDHPFSTW